MNDEVKKEIKEIWEEHNFCGYYKLYKIAKEKGIDVKYDDVKKFVQNQKVYKEHVQTRDTQHGFIHSIHSGFEWFCDLIDYQLYKKKKGNKNFQYILIVIDSYSRVCFCEALKNKKGETVARAFEKILTDSGQTPEILASDNGSEFISHEFKEMLEKHGIVQMLSEVGDHNSLGLIDRMCRTLKGIIWKQFTQKNNRIWLSQYKDIVQQYNETPNDALGFVAPNEVDKYPLNVYLSHVKKILKVRKTNAKKNVYETGDLVKKRLKDDSVFKKKYEPIWSKKSYEIIERTGKSYKLNDGTDKLYRQYDLLRVESHEEEEADDEKEEEEEEDREEEEDVDKHGEVSKLNIVKSKDVETTNGPRRTDRERKKNTKYTKDFV